MLSPIVKANPSHDNEREYEVRDPYEEFSQPSTHVFLTTPNGPTVIGYVCGYNIDGVTRGDDCDGRTVEEAPREIWFKYEVPVNTVGDLVKIRVENMGAPHYVDVEVQKCYSVRYDQIGKINCAEKFDLYQSDSKVFTTMSVASDSYWIRVVGFDESKEQREAGGDLTKISVTTTKLSSNSDRIEPEQLNPSVKLDRRVCNENCDDEDSIDPIDVYKISGFKGDQVTFDVGSREYDGLIHWDVRVYFAHERDLNSGNVTQEYIDLSDAGNFNDGIYVERVVYQFAISGDLLIIVKALTDSEVPDRQGQSGNSDEKDERYSIEFVEMNTASRDFRADLDNDGLPDYEEFLCGSDFNYGNSTSPNHDSDSRCDEFDEDDDNDGILDEDDNCQFSPINEDDFDSDGCTDSEDNDDDNDGVVDSRDDCARSDEFENDIDTDGDGCWNNFDSDDDNDGYDDQEELSCGTDSLNSTSIPQDLDGDGRCDQNDDDIDGDSVPNNIDPCPNSVVGSPDYDGDGCEDLVDTDDDNDGISDSLDNCPKGDSSGSDLDFDGCFDSEDNDADGDGFNRDLENRCGSSDLDETDTPNSYDTDDDGDCDGIDNDDDDDGVLDQNDAFPQNVLEYLDTDGDGVGNNADIDDDNDNVTDEQDIFPLDSTEWSDTDLDGTGDNSDVDKDGDGFLNEDELRCGSDPDVVLSIPSDFDNDSLCDFDDINDDDDGWSDSDEEQCGTDPFDPQNQPKDSDGDGECNAIDTDIDGDGIDNIPDQCPNTPTDGKDSNKDGCVDSFVESTAGRAVMIGGGSVFALLLVVLVLVASKSGTRIDNRIKVDNSVKMKLENSNMGDFDYSATSNSRQKNSDMLSKMNKNEKASRLDAPDKKEKFNSIFKKDNE